MREAKVDMFHISINPLISQDTSRIIALICKALIKLIED